MIVDNVSKEHDRVEEEEEEREKQRKLEVLSRLRKLLWNIDKNHDGLISESELGDCMADRDSCEEMKQLLDSMKIPHGTSAAELLCMLDNDGDGKLQYDEFVRSFFRLIESNEFQQICIVQAGINHLKNLVQV